MGLAVRGPDDLMSLTHMKSREDRRQGQVIKQQNPPQATCRLQRALTPDASIVFSSSSPAGDQGLRHVSGGHFRTQQ